MPSSNAPSSSAGATATDLRNPSTSVNHSRTNRTSRSSSARSTKSSCLPMARSMSQRCYGELRDPARSRHGRSSARLRGRARGRRRPVQPSPSATASTNAEAHPAGQVASCVGGEPARRSSPAAARRLRPGLVSRTARAAPATRSGSVARAPVTSASSAARRPRRRCHPSTATPSRCRPERRARPRRRHVAGVASNAIGVVQAGRPLPRCDDRAGEALGSAAGTRQVTDPATLRELGSPARSRTGSRRSSAGPRARAPAAVSVDLVVGGLVQ